MKTSATMITLLVLCVPSMAQAEKLVPSPYGNDVVPYCEVFDCGHNAPSKDILNPPSDLVFVVFFEIDEQNRELLFPVEMFAFAHTLYGEELLSLLPPDFPIEPTFDPWSWNQLGNQLLDEAFALNTAIAEIIEVEVEIFSPKKVPLNLQPEFGSTLCAATNTHPQPAPDEEVCWPNEPCITTEDNSDLGILKEPRVTELKKEGRKSGRNGNGTFTQDGGRRHMMTSRAG